MTHAASLVVGGRDGLDEPDADQAVLAGGEGQVAGRRERSVAAGAQLVGQVAVEVGEGLEEPFGMAQPHPREAGRVLGQCAEPFREDGRGPVEVLHPEVVRVLVLPLQAALVAEDADAQAVVVAGGGHAGPEPGRHVAGQLQFHRGVVEHAPPGTTVCSRPDSALGLEPGDVAQQVEGVGAQVPDHAGEAGDVRVSAPGGLLVPEQLQRAPRPSRRRAPRRRT